MTKTDLDQLIAYQRRWLDAEHPAYRDSHDVPLQRQLRYYRNLIWALLGTKEWAHLPQDDEAVVYDALCVIRDGLDAETPGEGR